MFVNQRGFTRVSAYIDWIRSNTLALNAHNQMALNKKLEAEENLKRAKELNQQGIDLFVKGDYKKANEVFESAYEAAPFSNTHVRSIYRSNQAHALSKLSRYEEASIKAKQALRLEPKNDHARMMMSQIERNSTLDAVIEDKSDSIVSRMLNFFG